MNITFLPKFKQVTIDETKNLIKIMREQGIPMDFVCGGNGTCGKCKVLVTKGNYGEYSRSELEQLSEEERARGYRLACDFQVKEDTCVILEENREEEHSPEGKSFENSECLAEGRIQVAFDIGSTTIEAAFFHNTTKLIQKRTRVNPQRAYGLDVMSRLSYAVEQKEHLKQLSKIILAALNEMIQDFLREHGASVSQLEKMVVMGNTTMIHLLLGHSVQNLLTPPFHIDLQAFTGDAWQYGFLAEEGCVLMVPPLIGGYVGSDTLGCILATKIWQNKENWAIMDIGTNGELVLSCNGTIYVCSAAAGPAFEGATIVQGMRAQKGAIYRIDKTGEDTWKTYTIENATPAGICGSGLIDAVSVLAMCGQIDQTGLMRQKKTALDKERKVYLYQDDIRQFQLAKAAIRGGFEVLMNEAGIHLEDLDKVIITGAFGSGVNLQHGKFCGLFPEVADEKFLCIDNGSLSGGIMLLQGEISMEQAVSVAKNVKHIELATNQQFRNVFIKHMDMYN